MMPLNAAATDRIVRETDDETSESMRRRRRRRPPFPFRFFNDDLRLDENDNNRSEPMFEDADAPGVFHRGASRLSRESRKYMNIDASGKPLGDTVHPEDDDLAPMRGPTRAVIHGRNVLWHLLTDPDSSSAAYWTSVVIILTIVASTVVLCIETLPSVATDAARMEQLNTMETLCIAIFTAEYLLKLVSAPSKRSFFYDGMNFIDLISILPWYIQSVVCLTRTCVVGGSSGLQSTRVLRVLRLGRVFRILKLGKRFQKLQILTQAIKESADVMMMLSFLLVLTMLVFSALVYEAERRVYRTFDPVTGEALWLSEAERDALGTEPDTAHFPLDHPVRRPFSSVPATFWFMIVTLMTVGYGDMVPTTVAGQLVTVVAMVLSMLVLALPISVVGTNFTSVWLDSKEKAKKHADHQMLPMETSVSPPAVRRLGESMNTHFENMEDVKQQLKKMLTKIQTEVDELRHVVESARHDCDVTMQHLKDDTSALQPAGAEEHDAEMQRNLSSCQKRLDEHMIVILDVLRAADLMLYVPERGGLLDEGHGSGRKSSDAAGAASPTTLQAIMAKFSGTRIEPSPVSKLVPPGPRMSLDTGAVRPRSMEERRSSSHHAAAGKGAHARGGPGPKKIRSNKSLGSVAESEADVKISWPPAAAMPPKLKPVGAAKRFVPDEREGSRLSAAARGELVEEDDEDNDYDYDESEHNGGGTATSTTSRGESSNRGSARSGSGSARGRSTAVPAFYGVEDGMDAGGSARPSSPMGSPMTPPPESLMFLPTASQNWRATGDGSGRGGGGSAAGSACGGSLSEGIKALRASAESTAARPARSESPQGDSESQGVSDAESIACDLPQAARARAGEPLGEGIALNSGMLRRTRGNKPLAPPSQLPPEITTRSKKRRPKVSFGGASKLGSCLQNLDNAQGGSEAGAQGRGQQRKVAWSTKGGGDSSDDEDDEEAFPAIPMVEFDSLLITYKQLEHALKQQHDRLVQTDARIIDAQKHLLETELMVSDLEDLAEKEAAMHAAAAISRHASSLSNKYHPGYPVTFG